MKTTSGTHGNRRKNIRMVQRVVISAGPDCSEKKGDGTRGSVKNESYSPLRFTYTAVTTEVSFAVTIAVTIAVTVAVTFAVTFAVTIAVTIAVFPATIASTRADPMAHHVDVMQNEDWREEQPQHRDVEEVSLQAAISSDGVLKVHLLRKAIRAHALKRGRGEDSGVGGEEGRQEITTGRKACA